jgi:hypothetical protein
MGMLASAALALTMVAWLGHLYPTLLHFPPLINLQNDEEGEESKEEDDDE